MTQVGESGGRFSTTVARELFVAVSGLVLVLFILVHLAGNFYLYGGVEAFNGYSQYLHDLGVLLWLVRLGLIAAFGVHVAFTIWLALANRAARNAPYAARNYGGGTDRVKLTMLYTGLLVLVFVVFHLCDFTFVDRAGRRSIVAGMNIGQSLGLYGIVWNAFSNPIHSMLYMVAMVAVGLHFSNAVSTIWVTLGLLTDAATAKANLTARVLGALIALGFSSIPIYVLVTAHVLATNH